MQDPDTLLLEACPHTRNPRPWKLSVAAQKIITTAVAMKVVSKESKIRCPNHDTAGFASPFDNCMACTDDPRSRDAQSEKKVVYTAYEMLVNEVSEQRW